MLSISSNGCRFMSVSRLVCKHQRLPRDVTFVRPDSVVADEQFIKRVTRGRDRILKHPGKVHLSAVYPPRQLEASFLRCADDVDVRSLVQDAQKLRNILTRRQLTPSQELLSIKRENLKRQELDILMNRCRSLSMEKHGGSPTDDEICSFIRLHNDEMNRKVEYILKKSQYNWKPVDFKTKGRCLAYALARFAPNYAVLCRALNEIRIRRPWFYPDSVFDFGSGVGSTLWAVENIWPSKAMNPKTSHIKSPDNKADQLELDLTSNSSISQIDQRRNYFCVDTSSAMIDVASCLANGGEQNGNPIFPNASLYFRQFLPASEEPKYDIVVSSFSLMDIQTYEERMQIITNLWNKTKHFLIIAEYGNRYGFTILMEIRDYLLASGHEIHLKNFKQILEERQINSAPFETILAGKTLSNSQKFLAVRQLLLNKNVPIPTLLTTGHVFAPCPHEHGCPRLLDVLPCKFEQNYYELNISGTKAEVLGKEPFTYLIFAKGLRDEIGWSKDVDPALRTIYKNEYDWPRLVRPVLLREKHSMCEMCTKDGILSENTFTRTNSSKEVCHIVHVSHHGDLMPVQTIFSEKSFDRTRNLIKRFNERQLQKSNEQNHSEVYDDQINSNSNAACN